MKILNIYSAWFLPDDRYTPLEIYIISPLLTQNTIFSKTLLFINLHPHLRKSGNFSVFKAIFLSLYDHLQTQFIIVITLEEFVLLQDLNLA